MVGDYWPLGDRLEARPTLANTSNGRSSTVSFRLKDASGCRHLAGKLTGEQQLVNTSFVTSSHHSAGGTPAAHSRTMMKWCAPRWFSACRAVRYEAIFQRLIPDELCLEQTSSTDFWPLPIFLTIARVTLLTPLLNSSNATVLPPAPAGHGIVVDVAALQVGDEAAWTAAFRQLWTVALGAARHPSACLTDGESEEAASEALAQLVSHIALVKTFEELKALAATIAFRRAISMARRKSAAKRGAALLSLDDALSNGDRLLEWHSSANDGFSDVEAAEMALLLQQALSELDQETRTLLEEKLVSGATYEEMSVRHGIPLGTACAKVARGLKKVRQQIEKSPILAKELRAFLR